MFECKVTSTVNVSILNYTYLLGGSFGTDEKYLGFPLKPKTIDSFSVGHSVHSCVGVTNVMFSSRKSPSNIIVSALGCLSGRFMDCTSFTVVTPLELAQSAVKFYKIQYVLIIRSRNIFIHGQLNRKVFIVCARIMFSPNIPNTLNNCC